jgi:prevent-host-death family protein
VSTFNLHDAKNQLSELVAAIENGSESEIIITRNGKPAARLVHLTRPPAPIRLGLAKGRYVMDDIDDANDQIKALFRPETG